MENCFSAIHAFKIDENGFVIDSVAITDSELSSDVYITEPYPIDNILIKPRWNGNQWVEGETEEEKSEREVKRLLESLKPSTPEITDAELEIKIVKILKELGVIQ